MKNSNPLRVGVLFGGRSAEHEVSLASARNVMDALRAAGHEVVPIGITREGRWLASGDPHKELTTQIMHRPLLTVHAAAGQHVNGSTKLEPLERKAATNATNWALLPQANQDAPLPPLDIIFPILHGPYGEDGTVQGLLEMAGLPYVGCNVMASSVAMDKATAKKLFALEGLPQAEYRVVLSKQCQQQSARVLDKLEEALAFPLFVKPSNMGSSVGVSKARNRAELADALELAGRYDRKLIVEQAVPHAREIEISVLGNDEPIASVPGEIVPGNEFYDYAAKYENDASQLIIPAQLTAEQTKLVQQIAVRAFRSIDGAGLARVDFLMDGASGALYLNEVNTMPGFTRISMYPKLWAASGLDYPALVNRLLELALERHAERTQIRVTR